MKDALKRVLNFKNAPMLIAVIVSIVALFVQFKPGPGLSTNALLSFTLFVLLAIAVGILSERIGYIEPSHTSLQNIEKQVSRIEPIHGLLESVARCESISAFYANRFRLPKFEDVIRGARQEIFWVGNIGGTFVDVFRSPLEQRLLSGCTVRMLLMNPQIAGKDNPLLPMLADITQNVNFEMRLDANLRMLKNWHSQLRSKNPAAAERLKVRLYDSLVTLVVTFVDVESSLGKINVELLPHKFNGIERPSFDLDSKQGGELYNLLSERYNDLWQHSEEFIA